MKKYELTADFKMILGVKLFKIKALVDFADVKAGEFGGYIASEKKFES